MKLSGVWDTDLKIKVFLIFSLSSLMDPLLYYYYHIQKVSMAITKNRLIIEQFSQMGDDLEGYFTKLVAGVNND